MSERVDVDDLTDAPPSVGTGAAPRAPPTRPAPIVQRDTPPLPQDFAPARPPIPDEGDRQNRLDAMKQRATGLLVAMSGVFVLARVYEHVHPLVSLLRATAEAGMVGGIADWFAVTALFRHPMGIPIPHTAII